MTFFRNRDMREGEPDYTCPTIDGIIAELEKVRALNDELRTWGRELYDRVQALEDQLADKIEECEGMRSQLD